MNLLQIDGDQGIDHKTTNVQTAVDPLLAGSETTTASQKPAAATEETTSAPVPAVIFIFLIVQIYACVIFSVTL